MTKEELKQEAEEWLCNNLHSASEEDFIKAMVDIAEPREKRIAELEKEIQDFKETNHELAETCIERKKRIAELEKENAELKSGCGMCYRNDKEKLVEAKELLKRWLRLYNTNTVKGIIADTEKFIKE